MHRVHSFICVSLFPLTALVGCSAADDFEESTAERRQGLGDPVTVLGFEDSSQWTASSGTKSTSSDSTQGDFSLGLASFGYAELVSAPLSDLTGVTSTLAFDVKVPVNPEWGQAALSLDAPSLGIYSAYLSQVPLTGSPVGQWRTLSFDVPSHIVTALGQSYSDLRFKVILNVPQTAQPYLVDNLRFTGGATETTVALNVSNVDDFVYVTINGLRRTVVPLGSPVSNLDISSWFSPGSNSVRIQHADTGGAASFDVELLVDGTPVVDESCTEAPCDPALPAGKGITFDETYVVTTPNRPATANLDVNGTAGAKIYIDDAYTGHSVPHSFTLPPGSYTVGVGVGGDTPAPYTGSFYEELVALEPGEDAAIAPTSGAPLATPNVTRIAILPIRTTYHGDETPENTGILSANDVTVMEGHALATSDAYVEPFSYGLTTWDIEVLPIVEDTPLRRTAGSEDAPNVDLFLQEANLSSLQNQYDSVVLFYSIYTASGATVANSPCCWWAHWQNKVSFQNNLTRDPSWPATRPNVFLLHEVLHNYEVHNQFELGFYNGAGGVHGGGVHGYVSGENGEEDFLLFYRHLMRSQLPELNTMRADVSWSGARPQSGDLWVGLFETFRQGVQWSFSTTPMALMDASTLAKSAPSTTVPSCALPAPEKY